MTSTVTARTTRALLCLIFACTSVVLTHAWQAARMQAPVRVPRITAQPVLQTIGKLVIAAANKPDVDLRPEIASLGITIRPSQNGRGTCSVFAVTFLLEYMYTKNYQMKATDLSEEFLNYASNLAIGTKVDGGFFDDIDKGYQKYGMVDEAMAPYQISFNPSVAYRPNVMDAGAKIAPRLKAHFIKPWDVTTGLLPSQLLSIMVQLKAGRPVAGGVRWPKGQTLPTETVAGVTMLKDVAASEVFDGHSIAFVGFKASDAFPGGGYLIFRNHWGTGFMDQGYGYMSFAYATKYTNDLLQYIKP